MVEVSAKTETFEMKAETDYFPENSQFLLVESPDDILRICKALKDITRLKVLQYFDGIRTIQEIAKSAKISQQLMNHHWGVLRSMPFVDFICASHRIGAPAGRVSSLKPYLTTSFVCFRLTNIPSPSTARKVVLEKKARIGLIRDQFTIAQVSRILSAKQRILMVKQMANGCTGQDTREVLGLSPQLIIHHLNEIRQLPFIGISDAGNRIDSYYTLEERNIVLELKKGERKNPYF